MKRTRGGTEATVNLSGSPAISGKTVTLTLAAAVVSTDTAVKVSYTKPTSGENNKLKDADDNETATFTDQPVTNNTADTTAPTFDSATVNGTSLVITMSETLAAAASLANTAFTVKKTPDGGTEATVNLSTTAPAISGKTVTLTLAAAVVSTDTAVKVSYTKPTSGENNKLKDAADNETATFTDQPVTNNIANNAPTVANMIPDRTATVGTAFDYAFPDTTFEDADGDTLTYTATLSDDSALPSWLTFTAATRTFSGTPAASDAATLTVKVTASDGTDSVSDTFDITVTDAVHSHYGARFATMTAGETHTFTADQFPAGTSAVTITSPPQTYQGHFALGRTNFSFSEVPVRIPIADIGNLTYRPDPNALWIENNHNYSLHQFWYRLDDASRSTHAHFRVLAPNRRRSLATGPPDPVTLRIPDFPPGHDGSTNVTFELAFSEAPEDATQARIKALVETTNATVHAARRVEAGNDRRWTVELTPSAANAAIVVSIPATEDCTEANAICSAAGGMLEEGTAFQIPYATPIVATFDDLPEAHGGNTDVTFTIDFDPEPADLDADTLKANLTVTDGTLGTVSRETEGSNARWSVTVTPSPGDDLVIALAETTDCEAANAICTGFGGRLETVPSQATIPYQAGYSGQRENVPAEPVVATFHGVPENHDGSTAVSFEIAFAPEPADLDADAVKANLTAYNGTVGEVSQVTEGSNARWRASVTPEAGNSLRIVLNPTVGCAFPNAICTAAGGRVEESTEAGIDYAAPLTVKYTEGHEPPAEHDGRTAFRFRISFSEDPGPGFKVKKLRGAFEVLQFNPTFRLTPRTKRVERGKSRHWEVTVKPKSNLNKGRGSIRVALEPADDCGSSTSVCTSDGRRLSNSLPVRMVQGPPSLSVSDAEAEEAEGATVDFTVRLSRAASETVTVDYATSDATATAGSDYTATSGTLTFAVGERTKTVSVKVSNDDVHDEGSETFKLKLSNASGGNVWIADGTAIGTITNDDPMPRAWLARFGRTVAGQAMDMVAGRLDGGGGTRVTVGGQALDFSGAAMTEERREALGSALGALSQTDDEPAGTTRSMTGRELLLGSGFQLSAGGEAGAPAYGAWGRFASGGFDAEEDGARMDGSVTSGLLGADMARGRWLAGLAVGLSAGEGTYAQMESGAGGDVETTMTALYPYGRLSVTERLDVWGLAGFGQGELEMTHGHEGEAEERFGTDLGMRMGALGARGEVLTPAEPDGLALAVRSDAFWVRTTSDAARAREGAHGNLAAAEADASRLRLVVEGSRRYAAGSGTLTPSVEVGLRHDGGDAETGTGIEMGAAVRYAGEGVSIEGAVRTLVAHEETGYEEWGASGAVRIDPGASGRGLSLTLAPTWGAASSGTERLWGMEDARALAPDGAPEPGRRFEAALGYGFGVLDEGWTAIPELGLGLSDTGRELRAGWRLVEGVSRGLAVELTLEGTRRERAAGAGAEHGLAAGAGWRLAGPGAGTFALRLEAAMRGAANDEARPEHELGVRLTARF